MANTSSQLKLCTANNVPFLATGGRHGYTTTLGELDNGLAIDLGTFDKIEIDSSNAKMTIGGGVRASQIYTPLYEAGFMIGKSRLARRTVLTCFHTDLYLGTATGSCSCVGMVGITLGAGIGRFEGGSGLLIDALESVRMVTAEGQVITVSAAEHEDLFWGIRGAGTWPISALNFARANGGFP